MRKSTSKCRVQSFITDTRNNGVIGTGVFLYCVDQLVTHGNSTLMVKLVTKTCAADAKLFRSMAKFVLGKAFVYRAPTESVKGGWIIDRAKYDGEERLADVVALRKVSFRSDAMSALVNGEKKISEYDLIRAVKAATKRAGDNGVSNDDFLAAVRKVLEIA